MVGKGRFSKKELCLGVFEWAKGSHSVIYVHVLALLGFSQCNNDASMKGRYRPYEKIGQSPLKFFNNKNMLPWGYEGVVKVIRHVKAVLIHCPGKRAVIS